MDRSNYAALEQIPLVGRFWVDAIDMALATADALQVATTRSLFSDSATVPVTGPATSQAAASTAAPVAVAPMATADQQRKAA